MVTLDLADTLTFDRRRRARRSTGPYAAGVPADDANLVRRALRRRRPHGRACTSTSGSPPAPASAAARPTPPPCCAGPGCDDLDAGGPARRRRAVLPRRRPGPGAGHRRGRRAARRSSRAPFTLLTPPLRCRTPAVYRAWDDARRPDGRRAATTSSRRPWPSSPALADVARTASRPARRARRPRWPAAAPTWFVAGERDDALAGLAERRAVAVVVARTRSPARAERRSATCRRDAASGCAFSIFLCFFLRMRLRRFLISEPIRRGRLPVGSGTCAIPWRDVRRRDLGVASTTDFPGSFNGRTSGFGPVYGGSSPLPGSDDAPLRSRPPANRSRALTVSAIVLAAGEGTRMRSARPKPLHLICGRAMVLHVIDALDRAAARAHRVVVGHGAERVTKKVQEQAPAWANVVFVEQADAARHRRRRGDRPDRRSPATTSTTTRRSSCSPATRRCCGPRRSTELVATHVANGNAATLLTSVLDDPTGYGRVDHGARTAGCCASSSSATPRPDELAIDEVNTSIYAFRRDLLGPALRHLSPDNAQGEYYLTDVVGVLGGDGPPGRRGSQAPAEETAGRQRPLAAGPRRARAARRARTATGCSTASRCSIPRADLHRRHRASSAATSRCTRARSCRATPSSATAARSGPTPASSTAWSGADCRRRAHRRAARPRSAPAPGSARSPPAGRHRTSPTGAVTGAFYTAPTD